MNPTLKKILIGFAVLLVLALLTAFVLMRGSGMKQVAPSANAPTQSSTTPESELVIPLTPVTPQQTAVQKNRNMTTFSMQFVERYGSYSTEGNFQNLRDLLPSMTDGLRAKTLATINAGVPAGEFFGITTKALSVKVDSQSGVAANVTVSTRRTETKGTATRIFNQDASVSLVQSGDEWLVESVSWVTP